MATVSLSIGAVPIWYIADQVGLPLGGGFLRTLSSRDYTLLKPVYHDQAGTMPWTYVPITNQAGKTGILFNENGSQGPFWFKFDSAVPSDLYFLEVYDSSGQLIWTVDNFSPGPGTGGSIVTTALDLENFVINGEFWRNISNNTNPATPIATTTNLILAPGCHAGFAQTASASGSTAGPDIRFIKNNLAAVDSISFPYFNLGSTDLTNDVTPVQYLRYECTNTPVGETQKCIQIPITSKVQNLTNQPVTITVWARANSGTGSLVVRWRQFFGDGGAPSADNNPPITTLTLTNLWTKFTITATVPSVAAKTLGTCGNDALFLQFEYPLGSACNIDITKPSLYLGTIQPTTDFETYDDIDGVLNVPRTGDIRVNYSLSGTAPPGWITMNDGSIGNAASLATTRANIDTFPLYNLIWTTVSQANAPVSSGLRGATSIADFTAGFTIAMPKTLGRALASIGTPSTGGTNWALGQIAGAESQSIDVNNLPQHLHDLSGQITTALNTGAGAQTGILAQGNSVSGGINGGTTHTNLPIMQPTQFMNFIIKL